MVPLCFHRTCIEVCGVSWRDRLASPRCPPRRVDWTQMWISCFSNWRSDVGTPGNTGVCWTHETCCLFSRKLLAETRPVTDSGTSDEESRAGLSLVFNRSQEHIKALVSTLVDLPTIWAMSRTKKLNKTTVTLDSNCRLLIYNPSI